GWITYNQRLENILTTNYSQPYEKQLDIIEFASYVTEYAIVESHWMEDFYGIQADPLILSKDIYMKDTYVFPISSRIYQNSTGKPLGWCLVV
ncbi:MAG: hypothetical protein RR593_02290, partial [Hungatella sp.]